MSSPVTPEHRSRGFTLIEIVAALVISGFVAAMLGSGLVYSVQLYRTIKGVDEIVPQADAAFNRLRPLLREGKLTIKKDSDSCTNANTLCLKNGTLTLEGDKLLSHVSNISIDENNAIPGDSSAVITHVKITLDLNGSEKTFEFDVCED